MLKLFVSAAQLALPLCLLTAAIVANRSYRPTERRLVGRLTVGSVLAGALAAAVIVFLRLTTKHVRLPVINLWVGTLLALALALFLAALWVMGRLPLVSADSGVSATGRSPARAFSPSPRWACPTASRCTSPSTASCPWAGRCSPATRWST